jgi:catechol 2,3-dioxygenase-like lactoylglutathione lyase family enzyme
LTVKDVEVTVEFYESVLAMVKETFGEGRIALKFGNQKINLHELKKETEPKASLPTPGSEDLCFITGTDLEEAMSYVKRKGVEVINGPIKRTGATGAIHSFYFRDPDGNLIEVSNYVKHT